MSVTVRHLALRNRGSKNRLENEALAVSKSPAIIHSSLKGFPSTFRALNASLCNLGLISVIFRARGACGIFYTEAMWPSLAWSTASAMGHREERYAVGCRGHLTLCC